LIQTDAKLNLGTSGGALLNLKGEMIGLTTALAAVAGYEQAAGYAIPVDETFRRVVETLKLGREVEYGFLGVSPESLAESDILAGRHGARVRDVVEGTPAHRFGLQHDDVITHVNGRAIHDRDGLMLQVGKLPVEALVHLTVERRGLVVPVNVELSKYPVTGKKIVTTPAPSWRGMRVDFFTADHELKEHVREGKIDPRGCVLITDVDEYSPAWDQGLRPNMAISHVGNVRVNSPKDFQAAVAGKNGPVKVRLVVPSGDHPVRSIPPEVKADSGDK
jgi:S1-C subfamily serine protease